MRKYVALIGATVLTVGTAAAQQEVPKYGAFLGYNYVRFNSDSNAPSFNGNGGSGQFLYNFNGWLSGVIDGGAVTNGNIARFGIDGTLANFLAGPRFSFRRWKTVTPFVNALFGGVHGASSVAITGIPVDTILLANGDPVCLSKETAITSRLRTSQTSFAMTAGGGLDLRLTKHIVFRPFAVEYYMTRLKNLRASGDNNQNNLRASAGFMFLFGGEKAAVQAPVQPVQPQTKVCPNGVTVPIHTACPKQDLVLSVSANAAELCPGDSTPLVATIGNAVTNPLNFSWSVNGQPVSQGKNFEFSAAGKDPGTYRVSVAAVGDSVNPASAETTITVLEYKPPTGTVEANPAVIPVGDRSTLSASFQGQCGGTIQPPGFEASEGTIVGDQFDSSTVRFDATSNVEQKRTVTITAKAADNKSVGTATTTIEVTKAPVIAAVRLPDVLFDVNSSRVNNCGKRILLEQLRAYAERDATGTVVLVGHSSSDEKAADLSMHRAMNAAAVITAGTGVCLSIPQSQVQISAPGMDQNGVPFEAGFCRGSVKGGTTAAELRRVEVWFVPTGGQVPATAMNTQAASAMNVSSLGCPK